MKKSNDTNKEEEEEEATPLPLEKTSESDVSHHPNLSFQTGNVIFIREFKENSKLNDSVRIVGRVIGYNSMDQVAQVCEVFNTANNEIIIKVRTDLLDNNWNKYGLGCLMTFIGEVVLFPEKCLRARVAQILEGIDLDKFYELVLVRRDFLKNF